MSGIDELVRERAYELWQQAGRRAEAMNFGSLLSTNRKTTLPWPIETRVLSFHRLKSRR